MPPSCETGARLGLITTTLASFTPYRSGIGGFLFSFALRKVRKDTVIQVGAFKTLRLRGEEWAEFKLNVWMQFHIIAAAKQS